MHGLHWDLAFKDVLQNLLGTFYSSGHLSSQSRMFESRDHQHSIHWSWGYLKLTLPSCPHDDLHTLWFQRHVLFAAPSEETYLAAMTIYHCQCIQLGGSSKSKRSALDCISCIIGFTKFTWLGASVQGEWVTGVNHYFLFIMLISFLLFYSSSTLIINY